VFGRVGLELVMGGEAQGGEVRRQRIGGEAEGGGGEVDWCLVHGARPSVMQFAPNYYVTATMKLKAMPCDRLRRTAAQKAPDALAQTRESPYDLRHSEGWYRPSGTGETMVSDISIPDDAHAGQRQTVNSYQNDFNFRFAGKSANGPACYRFPGLRT
jgi:hypothetical protein